MILTLTLAGIVEPLDCPGFLRAVVKTAGGDTFSGDGKTKSAAITSARRKAGRAYGATAIIR